MRPGWYDPSLAAALAGLPLPARRPAAGVVEGRHAARLPGTGLEFAQYRGYQPGDDPRRVDWKLLARSDRFFVREADAETAVPVRLLLDATASMGHTEDGLAKFDVARALVAALATAAVRQGNLPSLHLLGSDVAVRAVPPSRDGRQLERMLDVMDRARPAGDWPADADEALAELASRRDGVLFVVTDAFDPEDRLLPALERLALDATVFVLRMARERDLAWDGPVTLEDLETGARLTVRPGDPHPRAAHDRAWRDRAALAGVDVLPLEAERPLAAPLGAWLAERAGRR